MVCRECGKQIEDGARFCRYCGKAQATVATNPPAAAGVPTGGGQMSSSGSEPGLEARLRQLFPRHHLQDEFMHIGTIAAFFMAVIGFVLGFFQAVSWVGTNFLLGSIALLLFLILRESTLSHIRVRSGGAPADGGVTRYHAARQATDSTVPAEAANAESSPPASAAKPPKTPR